MNFNICNTKCFYKNLEETQSFIPSLMDRIVSLENYMRKP